MNNKQLNDVSRMNKGETMEQKTYRIMCATEGCTDEFKKLCAMLELAIAEEREACAKAIENGEWNGNELPEFIRNRGFI